MALNTGGRGGRGPWVALTVAVFCVGAAVGTWAAQQGGTPAASTIVTAKTGAVREKVAEPATVDDVSQADVNSDISGNIDSVDVQTGDYVYADETLAATDPYSADATLYEESLALDQDQAQLASDESDQSLRSAEAELTTVQQEVTTDQAAAAQAQAGLATLQAQNQASLQQEEAAVSQAEQTWAADTAALTTAQATLGQDQVALETAQEHFADAGCPKPPPGSTADCTSLGSAVTDAQTAVTSEGATVSSGQSAAENDQQSAQDDQTNLLTAGLNAQSSLTQATSKSTTAELTLSVAEASLANAQAAVSQSQREVDVVTQVDAQRVTKVESQVQSQKDGLRHDRLTAPISGTVKSVQIKQGMAVTAAPSALTPATKPPTAAIVIDSRGSLVAETHVRGSSAASIRVGDPVQLALPRHRTMVDGTVSSVGIFSTDQSGVESVPVTVMITGQPPGIRAGMTAEADITLIQKTHVLTVPSAAVHTSGTRSFVDEFVNGRTVSHDVRVGVVGTDVTQIVSGLSDGTQVVVPP
jgi:multidrug efflux pump subunit AcrA (membrane-fusion protein)